MIRSRLALALLAASGHVGALGPRLAAAAARAADLLSAAAHRVSPLAECPGCGKMAPGIVVEGGGCEACQHAEAVAPYNALIDVLLGPETGPTVNVTPYTNRRPTEEPS